MIIHLWVSPPPVIYRMKPTDLPTSKAGTTKNIQLLSIDETPQVLLIPVSKSGSNKLEKAR